MANVIAGACVTLRSCTLPPDLTPLIVGLGSEDRAFFFRCVPAQEAAQGRVLAHASVARNPSHQLRTTSQRHGHQQDCSGCTRFREGMNPPVNNACPLSGVKRTCPFALHMSAFDAKPTSPNGTLALIQRYTASSIKF